MVDTPRVLQIKWHINDYFGQDVGNTGVMVTGVWFEVLSNWLFYWVEGYQQKITWIARVSHSGVFLKTEPEIMTWVEVIWEVIFETEVRKWEERQGKEKKSRKNELLSLCKRCGQLGAQAQSRPSGELVEQISGMSHRTKWKSSNLSIGSHCPFYKGHPGEH